MSERWANELWRVAGLVALAVVLGLLTGYFLLASFAVLVMYLWRHLRQLYRLDQWLSSSGKAEVPEADGVWGDVFNQLHQLQKRDRSRKRKLANMLKRFNESTAAMPDATVILDDYGQMEWFNKAACTNLGLHPKLDIGQRIDNLVRLPEFVTYLAQGDYSQPLEMPSPEQPGVWLLVSIVPYGKRRRLLVVRDISRLHYLEQMRRDFVANVSHELRTPLTVINGYMENIVTDLVEQHPEWEGMLRQVNMQARRMQDIVEDLLMLSRLENDHAPRVHDQVAVPAMLAAIREDAEMLSGDRHHHITLQADEGLWLLGNQKELHSAFSNLVVNAVNYTPAGGSITISWHADDSGAHFAVTDTGIGIAAHQIPRLTERFYRVDVARSRETGGSGLGLAIVKHALQRHHGRLRIESVLGSGSTFSCDFPLEVVVRRVSSPVLAASGGV